MKTWRGAADNSDKSVGETNTPSMATIKKGARDRGIVPKISIIFNKTKTTINKIRCNIIYLENIIFLSGKHKKIAV